MMAEKKKGLQRQHAHRSWCSWLSPDDAQGLGLRGSVASLSVAADQARGDGIFQVCFEVLPFTPTASSGLLGQKQKGWTWPLGANSCTNAQSKLWHCTLSSLGWPKAHAFSGAANPAHLFLT